jgi:MerR family transcriptional regulator, thiopeptide resistance regulator
MDAKDYTVGAVAELTGVSVRALHHYDETGLLQPSGRNAAGYRLYSPQDLQRLQRVLFYRELGFGLDTIAVIVDDPGSTDGDHLRRQRQLLAARIERCQAMVAVIDKELSVRRLGISLTPQERLEVFGDAPLEDLLAEAERGFGGTAEWSQQQRTSSHTAQDWQQLLAESASIHQRLLDAMNDQVPAGDPAVMDLAEEHRQHTDRWFHDCGHEIHRQYAEAYLANDDMPPGLAQYCHDAIIANCQRAGGAGAPRLSPSLDVPGPRVNRSSWPCRGGRPASL